MSKEQRKHPRKPSNGHLRVRTSISNVAYTVSLRDVSLAGAFVRTEHFPRTGEIISFEILDEYGLRLTAGQGKVIRIVNIAHELGMGFAFEFDTELEMAMLDFLTVAHEEEFI